MSVRVDKGTIGIGLVREAVSEARSRGIDVAAILARVGISPALIAAPRARVAAKTYALLWAALADVMDDEFFGMDFHPMRRGAYRLMGHAVVGAMDLEQALRRMLGFLRVVLDDVHGELEVQQDIAVIHVVDRRSPPRRSFYYATWIMLVHGMACWLVGRRLPLREVALRSSETGDASDYRARFCAQLLFDAPLTRICLDRSLLSLKVTATKAGIDAFMAGAPANLLVQYRNESSIAASIRRILRRELPERWPELQELASALNMSVTTLQRRLTTEGLGYQALKDDLRRDMAIGLLGTTKSPISEVAASVGFHETSAFYRAFKKWTGVNPGAYRAAKDQR